MSKVKAAVKSRKHSATPRGVVNASDSEWHWRYCLAGALVVLVIAFAPAINGNFIFDDFNLPFVNPHAAEMPAAFWIGGVRPVLMATYWANFLVAGTKPFAYHVTNLLLHAAVAVLFFLICERILTLSLKPSERPARQELRWVSLFAALLFLLHPVQTESVDYIAGRSEVVSGLFYFSAWILFLRGFGSRIGFGRSVGICGLMGLAVLAKESAISLPAILLLTDFYFSEVSLRELLERRLSLYLLFLFGGTAAAIQILQGLAPGSGAGSSSGIGPFSYALTQCRAIFIYLRLFLFPSGQNGDWQLPLYRSATDGAAIAYAAALLMLVAAIVFLFKRARLISFGMAGFLLMLAPTSSFIPLRDALAERRMYLPIAGLLLALVGLILRSRPWLVNSPAWRRTAAVAVVVACAVLSFRRSGVWTDAISFWNDSAHANPANSRAHFGLGAAMMARGDCVGAAKELASARRQLGTDPPVPLARVDWNLGQAYLCDKKPADALPWFREYVTLTPTSDAYVKIGYSEGLLDRDADAVEAFTKALKLDPDNVEALMYRGLARQSVNDTDGARVDLSRAIELDPGNSVVRRALASLPAER